MKVPVILGKINVNTGNDTSGFHPQDQREDAVINISTLNKNIFYAIQQIFPICAGSRNTPFELSHNIL